MKKNIIYTLTISLCFFLITSAAYAQDVIDQAREGTQLIAKSKIVIEEGKKMKDAKTPDRAWMVDQGHMLLKEGLDTIESGEMAQTDKGRDYLQQVGEKMRQSGRLLLKMGRQKGELTQKEKEQIVKEADTMIGFGTLMMENGKIMGGN